MRGERAGEQQRADAPPPARRSPARDGLKALLAEAQLQHVGADEHERDREQPPAGLQEVEVVA